MTNEPQTPPARRGLGRGLDSLLPSSAAPQRMAAPQVNGEVVQQLALDAIDHNPYQTRLVITDESLQELAASIRENGVLQPIVVRYIDGSRYTLIAGERRL